MLKTNLNMVHTASLDTGFLVNRSLIDIYHLHRSGLQLRGVENVDKLMVLLVVYFTLMRLTLCSRVVPR